MSTWEDIFKEKGRVFVEPQEDMEKVVKLIKKEGMRRVLDLGCGTGRHTVLLAREGFDVYATDISKEGVKLTKRWLGGDGLKAVVRRCSCYKKFPFKDGFFDAVISTQVIHHGRHKQIKYCISEIERVLRPGGIIFLTFSARRWKRGATKFKIIGPRTYVPLNGEERGLPHFIYNKSLIRKDFRNFDIIDLHTDIGKHHCLLGKKKSL